MHLAISASRAGLIGRMTTTNTTMPMNMLLLTAVAWLPVADHPRVNLAISLNVCNTRKSATAHDCDIEICRPTSRISNISKSLYRHIICLFIHYGSGFWIFILVGFLLGPDDRRMPYFLPLLFFYFFSVSYT